MQERLSNDHAPRGDGRPPRNPKSEAEREAERQSETRPRASRRLGAAVGAGVLATAAMSLIMLAARLAGALGEPPPRKLTRKLLGAVGVDVGGQSLDAAALAAHFAYGSACGLVFALLPPRRASAPIGALFGLGVWAISYRGWIRASA